MAGLEVARNGDPAGARGGKDGGGGAGWLVVETAG